MTEQGKNITQDTHVTSRFRCERFHSKLLIPWQIAEKGQKDLEKVLIWIDAHQEGYKFKEGDEVAHKGNLYQKMYVQKILIANITMESKRVFRKLIGILCHWWEDCPCVDDVDYKPQPEEQTVETQVK